MSGLSAAHTKKGGPHGEHERTNLALITVLKPNLTDQMRWQRPLSLLQNSWAGVRVPER